MAFHQCAQEKFLVRPYTPAHLPVEVTLCPTGYVVSPSAFPALPRLLAKPHPSCPVQITGQAPSFLPCPDYWPSPILPALSRLLAKPPSCPVQITGQAPSFLPCPDYWPSPLPACPDYWPSPILPPPVPLVFFDKAKRQAEGGTTYPVGVRDV